MSAEDSFGEGAGVGVEVEGEVFGRDGESAGSGDACFAAVDVGRGECYPFRSDGELDVFGFCRFTRSPFAIQSRDDGSRDSVIESSTVAREDERVELGVARSRGVEEEEERSRKVVVDSSEEGIRGGSTLFFENVGAADRLIELQERLAADWTSRRQNSRETNRNKKS